MASSKKPVQAAAKEKVKAHNLPVGFEGKSIPHNLSGGVEEKSISHNLPYDAAAAVCKVFKALGEPSRLKIVLALMAGEMCVYHISESTGLKQPITSHQLKILTNCGIVTGRREGQLIIYKIADAHIKTIVKMSLEHLNCL